jgi:cell division inhibitor SepF
MSALHRLKAYFGMVPAEEFDAAEFDPAELDATQFDGYRAAYRFGYPDPRHDGQLDDYGDGFATQGAHRAAPLVHPTRSPSWATASRATESGVGESWPAETPVRGSLAIDPTAAAQPLADTRPPARQPVAPQRVRPANRATSPAKDPLGEGGANPLARIVTLHPQNYNEARPIGERYREGNPVIMNLTEMQDRDAKRLVDFAAGLAFALRGSIDKVTNKVFLLSPPNVDVSAEDRRRIAEGRFFN